MWEIFSRQELYHEIWCYKMVITMLPGFKKVIGTVIPQACYSYVFSTESQENIACWADTLRCAENLELRGATRISGLCHDWLLHLFVPANTPNIKKTHYSRLIPNISQSVPNLAIYPISLCVLLSHISKARISNPNEILCNSSIGPNMSSPAVTEVHSLLSFESAAIAQFSNTLDTNTIAPLFRDTKKIHLSRSTALTLSLLSLKPRRQMLIPSNLSFSFVARWAYHT